MGRNSRSQRNRKLGQSQYTIRKSLRQIALSKNHPRRPQPELWQSSNHPDRHGQNPCHILYGGQAAIEKHAGFCRCPLGMGEVHLSVRINPLWQKRSALCLSTQGNFAFLIWQRWLSLFFQFTQRGKTVCLSLQYLRCAACPPIRINLQTKSDESRSNAQNRNFRLKVFLPIKQPWQEQSYLPLRPNPFDYECPIDLLKQPCPDSIHPAKNPLHSLP